MMMMMQEQHGALEEPSLTGSSDDKPKIEGTAQKEKKVDGKPKRVCEWCDATSTPMWRRGPGGKGTLCNACGVRLVRFSLKRKGGRGPKTDISALPLKELPKRTTARRSAAVEATEDLEQKPSSARARGKRRNSASNLSEPPAKRARINTYDYKNFYFSSPDAGSDQDGERDDDYIAGIDRNDPAAISAATELEKLLNVVELQLVEESSAANAISPASSPAFSPESSPFSSSPLSPHMPATATTIPPSGGVSGDFQSEIDELRTILFSRETTGHQDITDLKTKLVREMRTLRREVERRVDLLEDKMEQDLGQSEARRRRELQRMKEQLAHLEEFLQRKRMAVEETIHDPAVRERLVTQLEDVRMTLRSEVDAAKEQVEAHLKAAREQVAQELAAFRAKLLAKVEAMQQAQNTRIEAAEKLLGESMQTLKAKLHALVSLTDKLVALESASRGAHEPTKPAANDSELPALLPAPPSPDEARAYTMGVPLTASTTFEMATASAAAFTSAMGRGVGLPMNAAAAQQQQQGSQHYHRHQLADILSPHHGTVMALQPVV